MKIKDNFFNRPKILTIEKTVLFPISSDCDGELYFFSQNFFFVLKTFSFCKKVKAV